jgi:glycosyltransferase
MKFSIITVTKNNKSGLLRAIECVRNQTYKNIEHIIVDGGSTDGTVEILNQVQDDIRSVQGKISKKDSGSESGMTTRNYQLLSISEPDTGIYDAINKGIKISTGDVIGLLHSDDLYADENVLEKYAAAFTQQTTNNRPPTIDAVYSDLVYVRQKFELQSKASDSGQAGMTRRIDAVYSDLVYVREKSKFQKPTPDSFRGQKVDSGSESGMTAGSTTNLPTGQAGYSLLTTNYSVIRYWRSHTKSVDSGSGSGMTTSGYQSLITDHLLRKGWMPPHPTLFIRKEIFEKYGLYNTELKIASDYEMILRLFFNHKITTHYLPITTYLMTIGGASNKSLKNILQKSKEDYQAMKMNGIKFPSITLAIKNLRKLPQFFAHDLSLIN